MTILGRAAVVAVVAEAVPEAADVGDDVVGDNAGADMFRPFRWGGHDVAGVLDKPSVGGRFFRGVSRALPLLPSLFASIYRPVMSCVTPREGGNKATRGHLAPISHGGTGSK
ncbi:hypothetical protein NicSoilB8_12600 [Arthrobacter sp. NicSoilB8]|nr:hypothetical protein NicSoilB8_12600 [Arthrobacter sp. NicSoilB8]